MAKEFKNKELPRTLKELKKIKGVGNKIALIYLQTVYGEVAGISVDTHVHRISNRLKWVNAKTPTGTQK